MGTSPGLALAATVAFGGCLAEHPPAANPEAVRLVAGVGFGRMVFWGDALLFTRQDDACGPSLWRVPLAGGEPVQLLAHLVPAPFPLEPRDPPTEARLVFRGDRLFVWGRDCPGAPALQAFDAAGQALGPPSPFGPGPWRVSRDGSALAGRDVASGALLFGAPGALAEVALPEPDAHGVQAFELMGDDLVLVAGPADAERGAGVWRVDAASRQVSLLVPPVLDSGGLHADGIDATGSVGANGDGYRGLLAVGCGADAPACPGGKATRCLLAYARTITDRSAMPPTMARRTILWDAASGTETVVGTGEIDGRAPVAGGFLATPDEHALLWLDARVLDALDRRVWTAEGCSGLIDKCRINDGYAPAPLVHFRPDGRAFAVSLGEPGDVEMVALDTLACIKPSPAQKWSAPFWSADGSTVALFDQSADPPIVHVERGIGISPEAVQLDGEVVPPLTLGTDGRYLLAQRSVSDQSVSLLAVDLAHRDNPPRTLAGTHEQLAVGARRVLATTAWQTDTRSGALTLFDLLAPSDTTLDRDVTLFATSGDLDGEAQVAYVVAGRFASTRDGIWLTGVRP